MYEQPEQPEEQRQPNNADSPTDIRSKSKSLEDCVLLDGSIYVIITKLYFL